MHRSLTPEQRADLLLHAITLDEKITMAHGEDPRPIPDTSGMFQRTPGSVFPRCAWLMVAPEWEMAPKM